MKYHYLEMILNFISSISWPLICLIIFYHLRKPLTSFLKKVKKVSYGETSIERQSKKQKEDKSIDILTKGNDFTYIDDTLNKFSESSKGFAMQIIENETKVNELQDAQQKVERLLKYAQLLIIVKGAEKIYQYIYGSQIRLLQKLNYASEKTENVKYLYDTAAQYFPEIYKDYSYESYLNWLVKQELISYDRENKIISITEKGNDFLIYLIESNSKQEKLY